MLTVGSGEGKRLDVYEYDLGWNGPNDPSHSVVADCVQHGYIFRMEAAWGYRIHNSQSIKQYHTLRDLVIAIDPHASLDLPDNLLDWWDDKD